MLSSLNISKLDREQKIFLAKALIEKRRRLAKQNFETFVLETKADFELNWHHELVFDVLQDFIDGKIQNLCIEAPPRHGKSEIVSRRLPAFLLGINPLNKVILGSYADSLAAAMNRDVQRIIDDKRYSEIFPATYLNSSNVRSDAKGSWLRNADQFETVGFGGGMKTVGRGAGATGFGATHLLVDDPLKNREEAKSKTIRDKTWDWFTNDLMTRLEGPKQILVTQTRWHEDDLIGRIKAHQNQENFPQFEVLTLQATKTERTSHPKDPRAIGEALWPTRYPLSFLHQRKASLLNDYESLFQQDPTPAEGGKLKAAWLKFYKDPISLKNCTRVIMSCDLSFDDGENTDFNAISIYATIGTQIFLIHQVRERMDIIKQVSTIRELKAAYPQIMGILVEKKANGAAALSLLKSKIMGLIPVVPTKSKVDRLDSVLPLYQGGNVFYPDPSIAPWITDHVKEMLTFPNAANDDRVDAESQALQYLGNDSLSRLEALSQM